MISIKKYDLIDKFLVSSYNPLMHSVVQEQRLKKNFDFEIRRDHGKIPYER